MKAKIHLKNISDLLGEQNLDNLLDRTIRKKEKHPNKLVRAIHFGNTFVI